MGLCFLIIAGVPTTVGASQLFYYTYVNGIISKNKNYPLWLCYALRDDYLQYSRLVLIFLDLYRDFWGFLVSTWGDSTALLGVKNILLMAFCAISAKVCFAATLPPSAISAR